MKQAKQKVLKPIIVYRGRSVKRLSQQLGVDDNAMRNYLKYMLQVGRLKQMCKEIIKMPGVALTQIPA